MQATPKGDHGPYHPPSNVELEYRYKMEKATFPLGALKFLENFMRLVCSEQDRLKKLEKVGEWKWQVTGFSALRFCPFVDPGAPIQQVDLGITWPINIFFDVVKILMLRGSIEDHSFQIVAPPLGLAFPDDTSKAPSRQPVEIMLHYHGHGRDPDSLPICVRHDRGAQRSRFRVPRQLFEELTRSAQDRERFLTGRSSMFKVSSSHDHTRCCRICWWHITKCRRAKTNGKKDIIVRLETFW
ncbi:hypothetical protein B0T26DRAFT_724400 [Lasiosphaeria miniovina]|uniref:Uncharacterized protein n=1 Tax=Lasiosphaeria miniovina TaxID=1954250 RepID=A0AA40A6K6_9PEZI|nr:uncharacterized protein B0T26DRAFT_724400 [Lasiosphaeria miniovina]KAK0710246.1 hypothetical protein B0T26DRAFT_724400 [Lasiosphaeria miniovina]